MNKKQGAHNKAQSVALTTSIHANADLIARCGLVVLGLAVGDSLGATSEFQIPWEVTFNCIDKYPGWPSKLVGGGKPNWNPGDPTDDTGMNTSFELIDSEMAIAILRAVNGKILSDVHTKSSNEGGISSRIHAFKPENILLHWLKWIDTKPKAVGTTFFIKLTCEGKTTHSALNYARTRNWWDGGLKSHSKNPKNWANGSLMRNGVIPALFPGMEEETSALDATIMHGIITHWNPVPVLCCVLHTLLIREGLWYITNKKNSNENSNCEIRGLHNLQVPPSIEDLKMLLEGPWKTYLQHTSNPAVQMVRCHVEVLIKKWVKNVGEKGIEEAQKIILDDLTGFVDFDFYHQGSALLSLKIALWALHWSFQKGKENSSPSIPEWLPSWIFELDMDNIMKSAIQESKLGDFGDSYWKEPLTMFINVLNDPLSSAFTRLAFRKRIRHILVHRLQLVELFKRNKELHEVPVKQPLFVLGLPRSGTSLLFALLSQDPSCRAPFAWEQNEPFPPPEKASFHMDPRIQVVTKKWEFVTKNVVGERFKAIHNMDPTQPEEDMELLLKSFVDPVILFVRPDRREYYDWFQKCDGTPFYEEEKRYLQVLGWKNPAEDHWVMKSPLHTRFCGIHMSVFPDAKFVWMHRRISEVVPSACSLMRTLAALYRPWINKKELGQATIEALKMGLEQGIAQRDSRTDSAERFIDFHYETLMQNPIEVVKTIYQKFGYNYTQEFEDRMKKWLAENPQRKYGGHKYTLEEYGMDTQQLEASFDNYSKRFSVPI